MKTKISFLLLLMGLCGSLRADLQFKTVTSGVPSNLNAVTFGGDQFWAVGDNSKVLSSVSGASGLSWSVNSVPAAGVNLNAAAYGNGLLLVGSSNANIFSTVNGSQWQDPVAPFSPSTPYVMGLAFCSGSGRFVAAAAAKMIAYSDGLPVWTFPASLPLGANLESYRGATRLGPIGSAVCGIQGNIRINLNGGGTWTVSREWTLNDPNLFGITWDGDKTLVSVGERGAILRSADSGTTWASANSGTTVQLNAVTYTGSQFIAVGNGGTILTSPDGTTWQAAASGTTQNLYGVGASNSGPLQGVIVAAGANGTLVIGGGTPDAPTNPVNQTITSGHAMPALSVTVPSGVTVDWYAAASGGTVLSGGTATTSYRPTLAGIYYAEARDTRTGLVSATRTAATLTVTMNLQFKTVTPVVTSNLNTVAFGGDQFWAVGDNSQVLKSVSGASGLSWSVNSVPTPGVTLSAAAYGSGKLVVGGANANNFSSADGGTTWTTNTTAFNAAWTIQGLGFNGGSFVAVASFNNELSYTNASFNWAAATLSPPDYNYFVDYHGVTPFGANGFAACSIRGYIRTSLDGGQTWGPSRGFAWADPDLYGIASDGGVTLVSVGTGGTILRSANSGTTWASVNSGTTVQLNAVAYISGGFIVVGNAGLILTSPDGTTWQAVASNTTQNLYGVGASNSGPLQGVIVAAGANGTLLISRPDIVGANTAPTALAQSNVPVTEDIAKAITLVATDPDAGQTLIYTVVTPPAHGSLSGTAPNLTYTPALNYNGTDSFIFKANDGIADSNLATISFAIAAVNDAPVANSQAVVTPINTAITLILTGSDVEGSALTMSIVTNPSHGILSGTAPNITYTPFLNYSGADSFTFKVNDGSLDSLAATVSITVGADTPPTALAQTITTAEDTAKAITLVANDPDAGQTLTYTVVTPPAHGTLSGTAPNLTYTPALNYNGTDSFIFKANDGIIDSNLAMVSLTITAVNDAPVANSQAVVTPVNTSKAIVLTGSDVEGSALTMSIVTNPSHGTLSGTAPNVTYTPTANYSGVDSFTFKVNDGSLDSLPAAVSITMGADTAPTAMSQRNVYVLEDTPKAILLAATDPDAGQTLTYVVMTPPAHGSLSGTAPNLTYTPALNYNGTDSFIFKANDGIADSNLATISFAIAAVNDAPVANSQAVLTSMNTAKAIVLTGSDVEGSALTMSIVTNPSHGTLSGTAPNVTYTPSTNYTGADSFTFKANDGSLDSLAATVSITVGADTGSTTDTTAPTDVAIIAPSMDTIVKGDVTLSATAADNVAVDNVEFFVDGVSLGADSSAPYSMVWHTAGIPNGSSHQLKIIATDTSHNSTPSPVVTVIVNNPLVHPELSLNADAHANPNPYLPSNGTVTFFNLPAQAPIKIYSIKGELVKELETDGAGQQTWNGLDSGGEKVKSGSYIVFVNGDGKKVTFKIAVIR